MEFYLQMLGILAGILFPMFLIKAIKAERKEAATKYTAFTSICTGYIVFTLIYSLCF